MKDRIKAIRKHYDLTQAEFGDRIGVKGNTITNYENDLRNPSDAIIVSICREFNVNEEWLRNGTGDMFQPITKNDEISNLFGEVLKGNDDNFKRRLINALAKLDDVGWEKLENLIDNISKKK